MDLENFGIGVDIESIKRFKKYTSDKNGAFVKKIYTQKEIDYCFLSKTPEIHLAARFCAKEAIYKAFCSIGKKDLGFQDVEILNNADKVPYVNFLKEGLEQFSCKLSLSHSKDNALASAIVAKNG